MTVRVLILAQGQGRRWDQDDGPYLGVPKHLVQIEGETLLGRQVRLWSERGCDVVVVGPDDPRYRDQCGRVRFVTLDDPNPTGTNMDKFLATRHLWADDARTVITWGDCWLTEQVVDQVLARDEPDYHVWRRPGRSNVNGARWDESFAVSFGPDQHNRVTAVAEEIVKLVKSSKLVHPRAPGMDPTHIRTHLAAMNGVTGVLLDNVKHTARLGMQTHVDDWSDDFDNPIDWAGWVGTRYAGAHRVGVCVPWTSGDRWRNSSHDWTVGWWQSLGLKVYGGDDLTGGEWPNRSAMRNHAARQAIADGCEVLLFADADTFVPAYQVWAAAHLAVERSQLVLAFTDYARISQSTTKRHIRSAPRADRSFVKTLIAGAYRSTSHASGAMCVPAGLFAAAGGYDERFVRWGFEDRAFWLACNTLAGVAPRIHGYGLHWWHPAATDKNRTAPEAIEGARLAARYYQAAAWLPDTGAVREAIKLELIDPVVVSDDATPDLEAMRSILAEPGGPLAPQLVTR